MQIGQAGFRVLERGGNEFDQRFGKVSRDKLMGQRRTESFGVGCQGNMTITVDTQAFFFNTMRDALKTPYFLQILQRLKGFV